MTETPASHKSEIEAPFAGRVQGNWNLPAMGNGASDAPVGWLDSLFDFNSGDTVPSLFPNPSTGEPEQNNPNSQG